MPRFRSSVSIVIHCFAPSPPDGSKPQAEHVAFAVEVHADRDVDGPVRDLGVADLDHDRVDQQHRIQADRAGGCCQASMSSTIASVIFEIVSRLDLGPVDLEQVRLDVAGRHALRVERDHVARSAHRGAVDASGPSCGSNVPLRSRGTAQLDLTDLGRHRLA